MLGLAQDLFTKLSYCHFMCCLCLIMYCTTSLAFNSSTWTRLINCTILECKLWPTRMKQQHLKTVQYMGTTHWKSTIHWNNALDQSESCNKWQHTKKSTTWQHCSLLNMKLPNLTYYWVQRDHFPLLKALGFSSIAAFARRTRSSFFCALLFRCLILASLLHQLPPLRLPLLQFPHIRLIFLLDLSVDPQLKITKRWRGLQNIQLLYTT